MLILILAIALGVGLGMGMAGGDTATYTAAFDTWEKAVKKNVKNDKRKKEAKEIVKTSRGIFKTKIKETKPVMEAYLDLDNRYDVTMKDYEASLKQLNAIFIEFDKQVLDERYRLKDTLTDNEWKKSLKYVKKKMSKMQKKVKKAVKKQEKARAKELKSIEKAEKKEKKKKE
jgi:hypothetical protein